MALAAAMTAAFAKLIQPVLDDVLYGQKAEMILPIALATFGAFFIRGIATYIHTVVMMNVGQSIVADIQRDLFSRFMGLDLAFFYKNPSGQLVSRLVNDVQVIRIALTECMTGFGKSSLTLILLIAVMFHQDWRLASAAFVVLPFMAAFVIWVGRRLRKVSGKIQEETAHLSDFLSQVFHGVRLVKSYGMERHEEKRAGRVIEKVKKLTIKSVRVRNLSTPFNELLVGLAVFGIIAYGGYQVAGGATTPGTLMSFIAAFTLAYEPMKKLAKLNNTLQMGLGAAIRVYDMLDFYPSITDKPDAVPLAVRAPEIRFEAVSFHYAGAESAALDHISFTLPRGKVSALVGPSGSGKTTIMNLIPRFFDVTDGRVTIDGHDVRDVSIFSLRGHIALVSQDITIFDDTVFNNIAYGRAGASKDDVIRAARDAAADEFITLMPDGYDTRVGENGVMLSGGQRQRIAIARAILRDAPILLLDEATSALDNEAERAIQATLSRLQKGRTTLVIAHRLSTIQSADNILVLKGGTLVEQGTHGDLMRKNGGQYLQMQQATGPSARG